MPRSSFLFTRPHRSMDHEKAGFRELAWWIGAMKRDVVACGQADDARSFLGLAVNHGSRGLAVGSSGQHLRASKSQWITMPGPAVA